MERILLLSEIFPPVNGGSGRWLWEVYSRIPSSQVVVLTHHHKDSDSFDKKQELNILRTHFSSPSWGIKSLKGLSFYWRLFKEIRRIIKEHNITQIHCGRCLPEGFLGLVVKKVMGIPYACYVHGEDVETASTSRELSWVVKSALDGADFLICNSQNTASIVKNSWQVDEGKVQVVHPGVDASYFFPSSYDLDTRRSLNWHERPVVLTVGRLQERKGHDMLIQALPEIKQKVPNILYAIVGNGDYKAHLMHLVESLNLQDNVMFMSELSDQQMLSCYQQCNVFALPNRTVNRDIEGFGMVLVEAQACGKPVIAGDSGGTRETMVIGDTGFILDCTSPKALASKLQELIADRETCEKIGEKGRKHIVDNLDWPIVATQAHQKFSGF